MKRVLTFAALLFAAGLAAAPAEAPSEREELASVKAGAGAMRGTVLPKASRNRPRAEMVRCGNSVRAVVSNCSRNKCSRAGTERLEIRTASVPRESLAQSNLYFSAPRKKSQHRSPRRIAEVMTSPRNIKPMLCLAHSGCQPDK